MVERAMQGEHAELVRQHLVSLHPIGRLGAPLDIAWGVLYLASDESSFMTGSELVIDGGYTGSSSRQSGSLHAGWPMKKPAPP